MFFTTSLVQGRTQDHSVEKMGMKLTLECAARVRVRVRAMLKVRTSQSIAVTQ